MIIIRPFLAENPPKKPHFVSQNMISAERCGRGSWRRLSTALAACHPASLQPLTMLGGGPNITKRASHLGSYPAVPKMPFFSSIILKIRFLKTHFSSKCRRKRLFNIYASPAVFLSSGGNFKFANFSDIIKASNRFNVVSVNKESCIMGGLVSGTGLSRRPYFLTEHQPLNQLLQDNLLGL